MKFISFQTAFIILVLLCGCSSHAQESLVRGLPLTDDFIRRQEERVLFYKTDQLMDQLGIQPGMVIVDIGTGSGQYAYQFAQRLKGSGKIYATDITPESVRYVNEESVKRGLTTIEAVQVTGNGLDPFYAQHRYDLVFFANSHMYIKNLTEYLQGIRKYLKPNGRVAILRYKAAPNFQGNQFTDAPGLLKKMLQEPAESPFYKYFVPLLPEAAKYSNASQVPIEFLDRITESFNAMLFGADLYGGDIYKDFLSDQNGYFKDSLNLSDEEKKMIRPILDFIKEVEVLNEASKTNEAKYIIFRSQKKFSESNARILNNVCIYKNFGKYLNYGRAPYLPGGEVATKTLTLDLKVIMAGYRLEGMYDFIPFQILSVYAIEDRKNAFQGGLNDGEEEAR